MKVAGDAPPLTTKRHRPSLDAMLESPLQLPKKVGAGFGPQHSSKGNTQLVPEGASSAGLGLRLLVTSAKSPSRLTYIAPSSISAT